MMEQRKSQRTEKTNRHDHGLQEKSFMFGHVHLSHLSNLLLWKIIFYLTIIVKCNTGRPVVEVANNVVSRV